MSACVLLSLLFLIMYVAYHMTSESTTFGGEGYIRYLYFFILISHIVLSIVIIPLVLHTYEVNILPPREYQLLPGRRCRLARPKRDS